MSSSFLSPPEGAKERNSGEGMEKKKRRGKRICRMKRTLAGKEKAESRGGREGGGASFKRKEGKLWGEGD